MTWGLKAIASPIGEIENISGVTRSGIRLIEKAVIA
jgi:hypothetical protein